MDSGLQNKVRFQSRLKNKTEITFHHMFDIVDGARKAKEVKFSEYFVCGEPAAHHTVCRAKHQRNECRLFSVVGTCSLFVFFPFPLLQALRTLETTLFEFYIFKRGLRVADRNVSSVITSNV